MDDQTNTATAESTEKTAPTIVQKEISNGVTKPAAGTVTRALWDIADRESSRLGAPASRKIVTDAYMAEVPNANIATANTQYARWVKFYNVADVIREQRKQEAAAKDAELTAKKAEAEAAKKAKAEEKEKAKAAKAAEREAAKQAKEQEKAAKEAAKAAAASAAQPTPAANGEGDNAAQVG